MDLVDRVMEDGRRVGGHWRVEIGDEVRVVKPLRRDGGDMASAWERLFEVHLVCVAGHAHWREFRPLSDEERSRLELAPGSWVLAMRPLVEGQSLSERIARGKSARLKWLARIAAILRGFHTQGAAHGALHPENVIVGPDETLRLVDVSPAGLGLGGSADSPRRGVAFRAPEMDDGRCGAKTDVFALAALCCWMARGGAAPTGKEDHGEVSRYGPSDVPEALPGPVSDVVRRALGSHADLRPAAQQFVDAVRRCQVVVKPSFVSLPPSLYRSLERSAVESLDDGANAVLLEGQEKSGRSFALERLFSRLQLAGRRVALYADGVIRGPEAGRITTVKSDGNPWSSVRAVVKALGGDESADTDDVTGDHRHVIETWAKRLRGALQPGETLLLWDDFDAARPDVHALWEHVLKSGATDAEAAATIRLVAVTGPEDDWVVQAERMTVIGPSKRTWDGWRKRTKWVEVRGLPDEKWRQIASRCAARPAALFEEVNEALDIDDRPGFAAPTSAAGGVPDVSVIFAGDWRRHLTDLVSCGAHVEAIETCEKLAAVLQRSGRDERVAILRIWLETLGFAGRTPERVEALERALEEAGEDAALGDAASLLRARLYAETDRPGRGLVILEELGKLEAKMQLEAQRLRARLHLMVGAFAEAREAVVRGLELVAEGDARFGDARRRLEILAGGIRAMEGEREAIEALRRRAVAMGDGFRELRSKARCHALCAAAWERRGRVEEAIDAYLRAIEVLRSGGLLADLPKLYLEVGVLYRRLGRLGLAREYCARGRSLVDETTWPSTRGRLLVEEAQLALALGREEEARSLVERAGEEVESGAGDSMAAAYFEASADLARREGRVEEAIEGYEQVVNRSLATRRRRANACVKAAETALDGGEADKARTWLERARGLVEEGGLSDVEHHCDLVRARLWWQDGDLLERMTGTDRFRRHLAEAADDGEYMLVLDQIGVLWQRVDGEEQPAIAEELAEHFHRAKEAVSAGLEPASRERFAARLPDIPSSGAEAVREVDEESVELVAELRSEVARLTRDNEELEKRLDDRDRAVAVLQARLAQLEEELEQARSRGTSGRGRPPKATRDDVIEALQRGDGDFDAAAELLGVSKRTLYRYVNRYDIEVGELE